MGYDPAVAERVRTALAARPGVVEKRMVGRLSFNVNGSLCCGVRGSALMVRVGRDGREWALGQPHVRPMVFGGRALAGFVCVDPDGCRTDAELGVWIERALAFIFTLPDQ